MSGFNNSNLLKENATSLALWHGVILFSCLRVRDVSTSDAFFGGTVPRLQLLLHVILILIILIRLH